MAKQARAKRPVDGGLSDIHVDPNNTTAPVEEIPFTLDLKEPTTDREMSPEQSKEFELDIKTPAGNNVKIVSDSGNTEVQAKVISFDVANIKFDINQAQIDEYKKLVPTLEIKDLEDRQGYAVIVETRKKIKKARTTLENARKGLVEDANKYTTTVNSTAKKYRDQLEPLEEILEQKETWFETERARIEQEKKDAEVKRVQERTAILITAGCTYDGRDFFFAPHVITDEQVRLMPEDAFIDLAGKIKAEHEANLEQQKKDADAAEATRLANEQKEKELKEERQQFNKEKTDFRIYQLTQAGLTLSPVIDDYVFINDVGLTIAVTNERIENAGASDWQKLLADVIARVSKYKAEQRERETQAATERDQQAKQNAENSLRQQEVEQRASLRNTMLVPFAFEQIDEDNISGKYGTYSMNALYAMSDEEFSQLIKELDYKRSSDNLNAIKAEKRRGDLKALGLTIETVPDPAAPSNHFVYRGTHVYHAFIPDIDEVLLKRNDDWWENTTLPGVKKQVDALKQADQEKITELLNAETAKKDASKGDKENLEEIRAKVSSMSLDIARYELNQPASKELLTRIQASFPKMLQLLDAQIELLTI